MNKQTLQDHLLPLVPPLLALGVGTNLAVLVSPIFMMQVLDRVLPSHNLDTLAMLLILAMSAVAVTAVVEGLREKSLSAASFWAEKTAATIALKRDPGARLDGLRTASALRSGISGRAVVSLLDLPWVPVFLGVLWLIHPAFSLLVTGVAGGLAFLTWMRNRMTSPNEGAAQTERAKSMDALKLLEQAGEGARLMGLSDNLSRRYLQGLVAEQQASAKAAGTGAKIDTVSRAFRQIAQISTLALGATLVTKAQLTGGGMVAASLLAARTVAGIDGLVSALPALAALRAAAASVTAAMGSRDAQVCAEPEGRLRCDGLIMPRGGGAPPRLDRISLELGAGECLAILGPSASGKSTLLDALSGAHPAPIGTVFFDDADTRGVSGDALASMVGYLPQLAHVLPGTIAENIARFADQIDNEAVLDAARLAGIHGFVSALPDGYATRIGPSMGTLTAGQVQRVGFARAIFGCPKYLFLDEPNALLDHQAERQLADALDRLRDMGTTIVLTAHRMSVVSRADRVVVLEDGKVVDSGTRADVLGAMADAHRRLRVAVGPGAQADLADWVARQFTRTGDETFCERATVVADELYQFAKENGKTGQDRKLAFEFRFLGDDLCSVSLRDDGARPVEAKIHKIRGLIRSSGAPEDGVLDALEQDERSLATVIRIADHFDVQLKPDRTAYAARIGRVTAA